MENNSKRPTVILALGMIVFLVGGFLFFIYVGTNGRRMESFGRNINFHSAYAAAASYFEDIKTGSSDIKKKADNFMSTFFEEPAGNTAAAARYAEAARRESQVEDWMEDGRGDDREGDSLGKYYNKNYGGDSGFSGAADGGGASNSASAGRDGTQDQRAPRDKRQKADGGRAFTAGASRQASAPGPAFGSPSSSRGAEAGSRKQLAALPARSGFENAAQRYGGGSPGKAGAASNKLDAMAGGQARGAGELNGADEAMSGGAQSNYNSKMSGGASSVSGGSSGGSVPAASGPANVSGDGGAAGASATAAAAPVRTFNSGGMERTADAEETDLFKSVVADQQTGKNAKYVSAQDAVGNPDEALLKSGAIAATDGAKALDIEDPKDLTSLSPERKLELKTSIHVFLKRIENRFGAVSNIKTVPCTSTLDLCTEHGVTGNYLSLTTDKGAKLDLGVKYIKTRWKRYTISFKRPSP